MADKNNADMRNSIDDINDHLTTLEQKVQSNQKIIYWATLGIAAIVAVVFIYVYLIHRPAVKSANDAIGVADTEMLAGNDSIALAQYQLVADEHGGDAANRANLNAAILLFKDKKYEEAIGYLKNYDAKESIIGAGAASLEGDCYVNLQQYPEALKCFNKAISLSDNNPVYTPFFMLKKATLLHAMQNYTEEAAVYEAIDREYPAYGPANRIDIQKYLQRAQLLADKK